MYFSLLYHRSSVIGWASGCQCLACEAMQGDDKGCAILAFSNLYGTVSLGLQLLVLLLMSENGETQTGLYRHDFCCFLI